MTIHSPCVSEDSAFPENTIDFISSYNHGLHTTGIAAGKGGIAPDAGIVAIQVFTDLQWQCTDEDPFFIWCPGESFDDEDDVKMCCAIASNPQDVVKAFDYLIGNANVFPNLAAVNLSMANNTFHESTCDDILYFDYEFAGALRKKTPERSCRRSHAFRRLLRKPDQKHQN